MIEFLLFRERVDGSEYFVIGVEEHVVLIHFFLED